MNRVFQAVSDENRRTILKVLKRGSRSAGELAKHVPVGKAALSHHLAVLKAADLVRCEKRGQLRVYSLNTSVLEDFAGWILDLAGKRKSRLVAKEQLS